jgi:hypothetical protein
MIAVEVNAGAVIADLKGLGSKVMKAAVRSMNRAIQSGKTEMKRAIASDTGLRAGDVADALPLRLATTARAEAAFAATLKRIPLIYFKARGPEPSRGKGRGVSYALTGSRNRVPNAFIAAMKSGHRGVFARKGTKRLPIIELYGPSLGHVFRKFRPMGLARTKEAFDTAFAHELKRLMDKQEPAGG